MLKTSTIDESYYEYSENYRLKYDSSSYVSEQLDTSNLQHNKIMSVLLNSDAFFNPNQNGDRFLSISHVIYNDIDFASFIDELQYKESQTSNVSVQNVETYESNLMYSGYLEDETYVKGNISAQAINTYKNSSSNTNYELVISLVDKDDNLDRNKLLLLSDDSSSEQIAYDIITYMQYKFNTEMEPDIAAQYFFNSSIEQIAGSISYHAAIALYVLDNNLDTQFVVSRTKQVNISTRDYDAVIVNHAY